MQNKTVGIIGAMDCEIENLKSQLKNKIENKVGELVIYTGELFNHNIVLVKSGVGKVNAALCTQYIIDKYKPNYIINTGIAGGIGLALSVGDLVIASELVQYDFDVSAIGYAKGYMCNGKNPDKPTIFYSDEKLIEKFIKAVKETSSTKIHKGRIATGDMFVSNNDKKLEIRKTFNAIAVEMEGCAIGQVATINKVPFVVVRAISDLADDIAGSSHEFVEKEMAQLSSSAIETLLKEDL
jgi:adenosylhomocysteine nucleosidase